MMVFQWLQEIERPDKALLIKGVIEKIPQAGLGFQFLADLYQCEANLNDLELIRRATMEVAQEGGLTVVKEVTHQFSPHGISCVLVLAESHLSIHTWPEHGYVAVDLFTCEERVEGGKILKRFQEIFRAEEMKEQFIRRGFPAGS